MTEGETSLTDQMGSRLSLGTLHRKKKNKEIHPALVLRVIIIIQGSLGFALQSAFE